MNAAPLNDEGHIEQRAQYVYIGLLALSIGLTWLMHSREVTIGRGLVVCLLAATCVVVDSLAERFREVRGLELMPWPYFLLQFILATSVVALFLQAGVIGVSWLLYMPLIAQTVIASTRATFAFVTVAAAIVVALGMFSITGRTKISIEATFGFLSAAAFVLIVSEMMMKESRARKESAKLADALAAANRKLSEYSLQVEELAINKERNRLAREIHDSLGHCLTTVNVQLEAAKVLLRRDVERATEAIDTAQVLTRQGLREVRESVAALRATPLDGRPLVEAVADMLADDGTVEQRLEVAGVPESLSVPSDLTLYRSVQEALTNVRKHAGARRVDVRLDYSDPTRVSLRVADDGKGSDGSGAGFGLLGIRERVHYLGGEISIETAPGKGFIMVIEIPR